MFQQQVEQELFETVKEFHACKQEEGQSVSTYGLRGYRKLNKGALDLYVGNGHSAAVEAIGSFELILPSGMILVLDNCHFLLLLLEGLFHFHVCRFKRISLTGFAAVLAVLVTGASQSRQHDKSESDSHYLSD
ncbi:hypothetical protein Tco_0445518 [Tanacetum coccineum]